MEDEEWIKECNMESIHITFESENLQIDDEFSPFVFVGITKDNQLICTAGVSDADEIYLLLTYAIRSFSEQFAERNKNGEQE